MKNRLALVACVIVFSHITAGMLPPDGAQVGGFVPWIMLEKEPERKWFPSEGFIKDMLVINKDALFAMPKVLEKVRQVIQHAKKSLTYSFIEVARMIEMSGLLYKCAIGRISVLLSSIGDEGDRELAYRYFFKQLQEAEFNELQNCLEISGVKLKTWIAKEEASYACWLKLSKQAKSFYLRPFNDRSVAEAPKWRKSFSSAEISSLLEKGDPYVICNLFLSMKRPSDYPALFPNIWIFNRGAFFAQRIRCNNFSVLVKASLEREVGGILKCERDVEFKMILSSIFNKIDIFHNNKEVSQRVDRSEIPSSYFDTLPKNLAKFKLAPPDELCVFLGILSHTVDIYNFETLDNASSIRKLAYDFTFKCLVQILKEVLGIRGK